MYIYFIMSHRHTRPALFPYTTLFRSSSSGQSRVQVGDHSCRGGPGAVLRSVLPGDQEPLGRLGGGVGDQPVGGELQHPQIADRAVALAPQLENLRSEEHTSELQSRGHLVCRLLLEKKNNRQRPL